MDFATSIRLAQAVEEIARDLYRILALRSTGQPALAAAFRRLEQEEQEHHKRLEMLLSMYLKDPRSFRSTQLEIPGIEQLVAEAKAFHAAVERGELDVATATARLVAMEDRFGVTHAETVARNADPGVKALFQLLASQDREHALLLKNGGVTPG
jgi:rubrerythrin